MGKIWVYAAYITITVLLPTACDSPPPRLTSKQVAEMVQQEAGPDGQVGVQLILVKRHDKENVEVEPLFVVRKAGRATLLVDSTGQRYEPTLDDFRAHNHLFTPEDQISVSLHFPNTTLDQKDESRTVSGHTRTLAQWLPDEKWWVIGTLVTVLLVASGAAQWRLYRRERTSDSDSTTSSPPSDDAT